MLTMKKILWAMAVLFVLTLTSGSGSWAAAQDPTTLPEVAEEPVIVSPPTFDLRTIRSTVTKDTDAIVEYTIVNDIANVGVSIIGGVTFDLPLDTAMRGSKNVTSGGSGLVSAPFINNPIKPGEARVFEITIQAFTEGSKTISAELTYWAENGEPNGPGAGSRTERFNVEVVDPSSTSTPLPLIEEPTSTPPPLIEEPTSTPVPPPPPPADDDWWTQPWVIFIGGLLFIIVLGFIVRILI